MGMERKGQRKEGRCGLGYEAVTQDLGSQLTSVTETPQLCPGRRDVRAKESGRVWAFQKQRLGPLSRI